MVETRINKNNGSATIVLRPNNSSSWQFNMKIVASLTLIALFISGYLLLQGLWLVIPFTVLEIIIVFVCLYLRMRANVKTEVISFDENTVLVERGNYFAEHSWKYHRLWTKIFVKKPVRYGHQKKIYIRSYGKELELGSFLNTRDKDILIQNLKNVIYHQPAPY